VTLCLVDNQEAEGSSQELALANGWKTRRFTQLSGSEIPYYDRNQSAYFLPTTTGERVEVDPVRALDLLEAAGNLTRKAAS
jgi:hypothetical protein